MEPPKASPTPIISGGGIVGEEYNHAHGTPGSPGSASRKSRRHRNSPSRFIARPSKQGLGVEEGDRAFLTFGRMDASRKSKRLRERGPTTPFMSDEDDNGEDGKQKRSRPRRRAASRENISYYEPPTAAVAPTSSASKPQKKRPVGSGAPRPPRVIVIGAGISGLACARELSERRHDVLVLEARNRIGGRLRTIDLMLDKEWNDQEEDKGSDLYKVRNWSPVDVGGAFIHGTGVSTTDAPSHHMGSHDFGTSSGGVHKANNKRPSADVVSKQQPQEQKPTRKSERLHHTNGKCAGLKRSHKPTNIKKVDDDKQNNIIVRKSDDGIGSLNPVYVIARQKLRLPVHAAEGAYTCLVDHNGNLISEKVDQEVSENFNNVLDLATKCCDEGKYEWKEKSDDGIGSLNPVYVIARQKLRLPVHAAEGAYTCLVDHNGNLISEKVDQEVSENFNNVLDLATKCCDEGKYEWKEKSVEDSAGSKSQLQRKEEAVATQQKDKGQAKQASHEKGDMSRSPNYVSDDTATNSNCNNSTLLTSAATLGKTSATSGNEAAKIDPTTDFGTVFEECKRYHNLTTSNNKMEKIRKNDDTNTKQPNVANANQQEQDEEVRKNLFQWHVANLEMSSGAPFHKLGQRWNDDEPFAYGGDHSYLEGGLRDVIEALAEGFDCRGIGNESDGSSRLTRRSGDFTSTFGRPSSQPSYYLDPSGGTGTRGIIQCGIEVNGIKIIEKEEVKLLRKQQQMKKKRLQPQPELCPPPAVRRSSRENRGSKMSSFLDALSSRPSSRAEDEPTTKPAVPPPDKTDEFGSASSYGNEHNTVVQVTTKCGLTLEADAVIVTTPLAILSIPKGSPGHISFSPPLPTAKQNALNRLGVGAYNKCCMSFEKPFWNNLPRHLSKPGNWNDEMTQRFDFIGHASAEHGKDILFFNVRDVPILIAIYGGSEYAERVEEMHDEAVVFECMKVLKKICSRAIKGRDDSLRTRRQVDLTVPDWPIDFFVSRWGSDPFSRGAFCYVPKGVNGFEELKNMSKPINDFRPELSGEEAENNKPKRPLIMFAGEATTPYHPSTIHGAFETGIREAYRLDLALEPELNGITFDESYLYQPTFSVRRGQVVHPNLTTQKIAPKTASSRDDRSVKHDVRTKSWWFDHDASILRGVETLGPSDQTMSFIKTKVLAPSSNTHTVEAMQERYKSLMKMMGTDDTDPALHAGNKWDLPRRRGGTWLAEGVAQNLGGNNTKSNEAEVVKTDEEEKGKEAKDPKQENIQGNLSTFRDDDIHTRRSSRKVQRKMDESFTFY